MTQNSRRQKVMIAVVLSLFVLVMQVGLMAQTSERPHRSTWPFRVNRVHSPKAHS